MGAPTFKCRLARVTRRPGIKWFFCSENLITFNMMLVYGCKCNKVHCMCITSEQETTYSDWI